MEQVVIFSHSLRVLDDMTTYLGLPADQLMRIDGSTPAGQRQASITAFNTSANPCVFLLSTKAGAEGINLTSARHLVLYDATWNPVSNMQVWARFCCDCAKIHTSYCDLSSANLKCCTSPFECQHVLHPDAATLATTYHHRGLAHQIINCVHVALAFVDYISDSVVD
jgi:hypothetical protein